MDPRQIQQLIPILLVLIGPLLAKYGITADQANTFVGATMTYALSFGIPAAAGLYHLIINTRANRLKAAKATPGVAHILMDTQPEADALAAKTPSGAPIPDGIIGPKELPAITQALPDVKNVVMTTEAAAQAIPSPGVVGPSALKDNPAPAALK
jgi:hypothetical protein